MSLRGRVGLFGGTFNPLHNAHILVARTALEQFELSRVIFIPAGIPPHKRLPNGVTKEDRYRMVKAAVECEDGFSVSRIEIDREGPSYTIDTIRALKDDYPEGICFIVGADRLLEIDTWKEAEELLASVPFIIAPRPGVPLSAFREPPFDRASIHPLDMPEIDLSSTSLREMVREGEGIDRFVPAEVAAYIIEHGLYRDTRPVEARSTT